MTDTNALAWVRSSQGSDSDIGLEQQREVVPAHAHDIADDVDVLDLGIHTGFSRISSDRLPLKNEFIDTNNEVSEVVEDIRDGAYDLIVAWDDTRVARDEYFHVLEHAAAVGGAEWEWVSDVPADDMAFAVNRVVELRVKLREMEKSQKAKMKRQEDDLPDGRPPLGLQYNGDKTELVPDPDEWDTAVEILDLDDEGESQRGISREIDESRDRVRTVLSRHEDYTQYLGD